MATWLEAQVGDEASSLATEQRIAFTSEVRRLFDAAGTPGLDRENSYAIADGVEFGGALLIVLPLVNSPRASIQLQMTSSMILGTWDDQHYVWDTTRDGEEALRVEGVDDSARTRALQWLDHEIHRHFIRRDYRWGPLRLTTWEHEDGDEFGWFDSQGFLPVRPRGTQTAESPAGYLDSPSQRHGRSSSR